MIAADRHWLSNAQLDRPELGQHWLSNAQVDRPELGQHWLSNAQVDIRYDKHDTER